MDIIKEKLKQSLNEFLIGLSKQYLEPYTMKGFQGILQFNMFDIEDFCIYIDRNLQPENVIQTEKNNPVPNIKLSVGGDAMPDLNHEIVDAIIQNVSKVNSLSTDCIEKELSHNTGGKKNLILLCDITCYTMLNFFKVLPLFLVIKNVEND